MVISTGITLPRMDSVCALYALQNSMMFTPCGPRAVPTGGAGVAAPAWSCTLTSAAIFFLGGICSTFSRGHDEGPCPLPLVVRSPVRSTWTLCLVRLYDDQSPSPCCSLGLDPRFRLRKLSRT